MVLCCQFHQPRSDNDVSPSFSPDGAKILFSSDRDGDYDIYAMDAEGGNQAKLPNIAGSEFHASYTQDGERVVYYSDNSGNREIHLVDLEGSNLTNLTNDPADGRHSSPPGWSGT